VLVASAFSLFFSHAQRGHAQDYRFHYKRENYGYHHLSAMYEVVSQGVERKTRRGTSFPRARPLRHNINTPLARITIQPTRQCTLSVRKPIDSEVGALRSGRDDGDVARLSPLIA
jgi:hypothetical protein